MSIPKLTSQQSSTTSIEHKVGTPTKIKNYITEKIYICWSALQNFINNRDSNVKNFKFKATSITEKSPQNLQDDKELVELELEKYAETKEESNEKISQNDQFINQGIIQKKVEESLNKKELNTKENLLQSYKNELKDLKNNEKEKQNKVFLLTRQYSHSKLNIINNEKELKKIQSEITKTNKQDNTKKLQEKIEILNTKKQELINSISEDKKSLQSLDEQKEAAVIDIEEIAREIFSKEKDIQKVEDEIKDLSHKERFG